jgi:outer membrane protein OmpA-like peptidoglycan-associated protein
MKALATLFVRSALLSLATALMVTLVASCASAPTPVSLPPSPPQAQIAGKLAELGFERTDEGYVLNLPGPLLFETGSDVLNDSAKVRLASLAADLHKLEIRKLRLFGHTDNVGSAEFNRTLSGKRAEAVAHAISAHGFTPENLERRGFGFDRPLVSNETPEGRAKNRRVAIIVPFE